jgi:hypothetical protein
LGIVDIILSVPVISLVSGYVLGRLRRRAVQNSIENTGEALVRQALVKYCKNRGAHILNNITLRLADSTTTQIDHILVSAKGVFVIETKHYSGWIFADPKSRVWTQVFFKIKYKFQNPIFQNCKHVRAVRKQLEFISPKCIYNIVVFTGDAEFQTTLPKNVLSLEELIPAIEQYPDGLLSLNRVHFCVGRLECMRLELTRQTDIEHHEHLNKRFG